ncbi:hypothetical protein CC85DRAFT_282380 [Cutaneotrichosporon oleaginosum]|uniref:BAH-domain-containing protein n=1 Tax=Cutaneotrichosporon oleaginosum TaxID=879819 RepID=A0A0J1BCK1_9TREE|nr:uncharacterized protein CC85DRAFT_282380 [Cutaneotrichosporon oleaginosum]KLT45749.1 hypothetical protein CC85DRAFT_282380 [Cutaneotrichosporon oleaginosum]TXT04484.1 hypothetical protein COLE_07303 [Cutaneotrichosporon oleaginosum]
MPSRASASDMAQQGFTVLSAKAANGEVVHINDHVYVSMPWSDRDGSPYIIARILEFVSAGNAHKKGTNSRHVAKNELHVRLSLYYRPSDISGRPVSDFRQLLAAIHTLVEPVSVIRGKCYVRHKDKIENLIAYKQTPDHFYFSKFYDPYIKREYEVLRTASVNNIPPDVKAVLLRRYEYLLTEKEMVADLLDDYHSCAVCARWAAAQDTVRCELCRGFFHMACLTPPLSAKPAKGYSWACLGCTIQRRRDVESEKYRFVSNGGSAPPRVKAGKKERAAISDTPDVQFRGWPWRYFGLHTRAEDTLSEEDLIFPRAVTRVGPKYTANVLTWEEQQAAEAAKQDALRAHGPPADLPERGFDPDENGYATTLTVLSKPDPGLGPFMDAVARLALPVPPYDISRLDKGVHAYMTLGATAGMKRIKALKPADFDSLSWSAAEDATLEAELTKYGGLDAHAISKAVGKRPAEVVRYTFKWRNLRLKTENDLIRQHRKVHGAHRHNGKTLGPPALGKMRSRADSEASDEGSLYGAAHAAAQRLSCAACGTRASAVWWKCPRSVQGAAMCEPCGSNYRKYGVISFVKSDDAKQKKDVRRRKDTSGASTPVPVPRAACALCRRADKGLARCKTCTFSVHAACYGIVGGTAEWECELCANARAEEVNLDPRCVLCPADMSVPLALARKKKPADFDALAAMKRTEGCRWAHVLCAAVHDVAYAHPAALGPVEGIGSLPAHTWRGACDVCARADGAKVDCADCGARYHVACAWAAGHRVGLHMAARRGHSVRFRDEGGVMAPAVWCRSHGLEGRVVFELFDEADGQTALGVYAQAYKGVQGGFALLRKAQRLDRIHAEDREGWEEEREVVERACTACGVDVSPRWHQGLCHQCWFAAGKPAPPSVPAKRKAEAMDDVETKPVVNGRAVLV